MAAADVVPPDPLVDGAPSTASTRTVAPSSCSTAAATTSACWPLPNPRAVPWLEKASRSTPPASSCTWALALMIIQVDRFMPWT